MRHVDIERFGELQRKRNVRNVCILAHVDHGKTTLADYLVASNGLISQKMAGKLRYLDSRADEQERGITMKSSSVTLHYKSIREDTEILINLIDSPGHVDFSGEVSTAVRLCDGAVILVDVVEGVCPQTRICLKQAYMECLKPILVLSKIDRLFLEKQMKPHDAFIHLSQVLENVNAVYASIFASDVMAKEDVTSNNDYTSALENVDDSKLYFLPEAGNVIFCSALDGWGFSIMQFAVMYEKKLGVPRAELLKAMWGNYYYNAKTNSCLSGAQEKARKPMFVQFILENIWHIYETILVRKDREKMGVIAEKLGINLTARDLRSTDHRHQLKTLFSQWLPLSNIVLESIYKYVPAPYGMSSEKAERLMCSLNQDLKSYPAETQVLQEDFMKSDPESSNKIVFISKMCAVDPSQLPKDDRDKIVPTLDEIQRRREIVRQKIQDRQTMGQVVVAPTTEEDSNEISSEDLEECNEAFIAFGRVFSGTLRKGDKMYVLGPKHDPKTIDPSASELPNYVTEVTISSLFIFMGRELENIDEVCAGNIVGIGGLDNHIIQTATLSSNYFCPPFTDMELIATPILRVAVEPKVTQDMPKLIKGLKLLNQADPCVQVLVQETGEHVLLTLGEVHLDRCILDLENRFARIELNVSKPIVPFRETIVTKATVDMVNEAVVQKNDDIESQIVTITTANRKCSLDILALPLPGEIVEVLDKSTELLKIYSKNTSGGCLPEKTVKSMKDFREQLSKAFEAADCAHFPKTVVERLWSIGPRKCGANILLNLSDFRHNSFWEPLGALSNKSLDESSLDNSLVSGFQLATLSGPLCEEPLYGVCFILMNCKIENDDGAAESNFGPISGQLMSAMKEGCRRAFQKQPQRLVTPMYSCNIVVNAEVLGKLYAVIGRRNGRILSGDLTEGSDNFSVTAIIPVIESFNFAQEIRKQTSGLASPQLLFSHWEILDIDPFWVPSTEEEYLHFGEKADTENRAKTYMDSVRRRKGLPVEEKIVEHAEKQRTLGKNK
ncbi:elongation factor-like GTPase 1 [Lutzomyia longipalpis]|uniref:Ribosome assembly protein 1 n=1 Tax=Lutzomyia longipalpis TaxID=7200 RepID=A0A1B0EWD2_LUTLO|nr:elongation factor-like GTPase 1 [Lutzomyia longipalpis]XP_055679184.1 elongation factor-like GTPase 1 [Lutzomyia longipalpis]